MVKLCGNGVAVGFGATLGRSETVGVGIGVTVCTGRGVAVGFAVIDNAKVGAGVAVIILLMDGVGSLSSTFWLNQMLAYAPAIPKVTIPISAITGMLSLCIYSLYSSREVSQISGKKGPHCFVTLGSLQSEREYR